MSLNKALSEALKEGKSRLKAAHKENYSLEAERLLTEVCGISRAELFTKEDNILSDEEYKKYDGFLSMREKNRPLQYILGKCEFMGLPFFVGEGVLIPRSDTECLVEAVLEYGKKEGFKTVLDIGAGSGCISVALSRYGNMAVTAVDISPKALEYAVKNGEANNAGVTWLLGDMFSPLPKEAEGAFDVIVSNPPYIPKDDITGLMPEVRDYEPETALNGGADGLDYYRKILEKGQKWLKPGGRVFFEIGCDQGEALLALFNIYGYEDCRIAKDLAGLDRIAIGRLKV